MLNHKMNTLSNNKIEHNLCLIIFILMAFFIPVAPICLIVSFLGFYFMPNKWRYVLPFLVYAVFVGAYTYEPPPGEVNNDLIRYLPSIEEYGNMTLAQALHKYDDMLISRDILFWVFGKLGLPHMVPALTTATVYCVAGYITCDTAERNNSQRYTGLIITFQMLVIPYIPVINNIRNVFSFSLVILAVYLDIVKKKRNIFVFFLYAFGTFMHLSTFVLVVFRIITNMSKRYFTLILPFPFLFSSIIMILYNNIMVVSSIPGSLGASVRLIVIKLYGYLTDKDSDYAVRSMTSITFRADKMIVMTITVLVLTLIYYLILKEQKRTTDKIRNLYYFLLPLSTDSVKEEDVEISSFAGLIAIMTLSCSVFAMPNYWRFAAALMVISSVIIIPSLKKMKKNYILPKIILSLVFFMAPLKCFVLVWRYRGYNYVEWFSDILQKNLVSFFIVIIKGIMH